MNGRVLIERRRRLSLIPFSRSDHRDGLPRLLGDLPITLRWLLDGLGVLCGFSNDAFGRLLLDRLEQLGVDLSLCLESSGWTTLGIISGKDVIRLFSLKSVLCEQ